MSKGRVLGIIAILTIQVLGFAFFINQDKKRASRIKSIDKKTKIIPVVINRMNNRGAIFINDSLVVNSRCEAIKIPKGFDAWASNGPTIDFDTIAHIYRLGDLSIPYILSKKENNDTLLVNKDGFRLKFLLVNSDN